ncbi:hypothetical protein ACFLX3_00360 [Chloroflexota bacterium]
MDVSELLSKEETIIKKFDLKGRLSIRAETVVYATNKRLFIDNGYGIRDVDYKHISSMAIKDSFGTMLLLLGFLIALVGAIGLSGIIEFVSELLPDALSGAFIVIGLILFGLGLIKSKELQIAVPGLPKLVTLRGARTDLEKVFVIARDPYMEV